MAATNPIGLLRQILQNMLHTVGRAGAKLFTAVWPHVQNAWNVARHAVMAHPNLIRALVFLAFAVLVVHPAAKFVVQKILGFAAEGIRAGSIAAQMQSALHGGYVPAGSVFAKLQSFGALSL